jgi:hypothetical protein
VWLVVKKYLSTMTLNSFENVVPKSYSNQNETTTNSTKCFIIFANL